MDAEQKNESYWVDYGRPEPGSRIQDIPTLERILNADGGERPVPLQGRGDLDPAPRLITYDRYIDPKFVPLEIEHIWKKQWQVACREEDIPNIGDRISYDIVDNSYLIVRTGEKDFKAFYNSCRHRGRKLCDGKTGGKNIQCGFHGWVFGLDGTLQWIPFEQEFPHVDAAQNSLIPVETATWGGNVFVNPDPDAGPLEDALGPLVRHFAPYPQEERYTAMRIFVNIRCNWKAAQEAFMEAYHVVETHADGMPVMGSVATQIDIWSEGKGYVSRLCTPGMTTDPYIADRVTTRQGLNLYCHWHELPLPPEDRGNTPEDARRYAAEMERAKLEASTGRDYSCEPVSTFLDMAKYFMFPNFHPWWGEGIPWWYNFTPQGQDPDKCRMEVRILLPVPASGERPPVPEPILVDFDERAVENPALGGMGHIIDQDLINMTAVQQGFKAAAPGKAFLTLSRHQEAKVRRFHEIYDNLLGLDMDG
jgi:nitrite reductase/ring-hydroxylating ferredoxin subunit